MIQVDETVKNSLEREVGRVNRFIETLRRGRRSEEMECGGDNTPLSEVADATQMVEEKEIDTQLLTWLTDRAFELDRALCRIEEGTYGICGRCERPIHPERLQALPEAPFCLECQKAVEAERHAPPPRKVCAPVIGSSAIPPTTSRIGGGSGRDEESRHQAKESLPRSRAL